MYRIPQFQDREHKLDSSTEQTDKTIRVGRFANAQLYWREDDYKAKSMFPPNVGYARVPPIRRAEFDRALDSFVREITGRARRGQ